MDVVHNVGVLLDEAEMQRRFVALAYKSGLCLSFRLTDVKTADQPTPVWMIT